MSHDPKPIIPSWVLAEWKREHPLLNQLLAVLSQYANEDGAGGPQGEGAVETLERICSERDNCPRLAEHEATSPDNDEADQPTESAFDQHFDEEEPEGGWATPAQSDPAETEPDATTDSFESGILRKTRITYAFDVESASDIGMRAIGMAFSACLGEAVEEANKIGQETERTTFLGPVKIVHWELLGLTSSRA